MLKLLLELGITGFDELSWAIMLTVLAVALAEYLMRAIPGIAHLMKERKDRSKGVDHETISSVTKSP